MLNRLPVVKQNDLKRNAFVAKGPAGTSVNFGYVCREGAQTLILFEDEANENR